MISLNFIHAQSNIQENQFFVVYLVPPPQLKTYDSKTNSVFVSLPPLRLLMNAKAHIYVKQPLETLLYSRL